MRFLFGLISLLACQFAYAMCDVRWDAGPMRNAFAQSSLATPVALTVPGTGQRQVYRWGDIKIFLDAIDRLAPLAGLNPHVVLCGNPTPNAFAVPTPDGDVVAVFTGLIQMVHGDADMAAFVMAHEMAHHAKGHMKAAFARNAGIDLLSIVAGAYAGKRLADKGYNPNIAMYLSSLGGQLVEAKFGRDQEREADEVGFQYMVDAGYNPLGAIRITRAFKRFDHTSGMWLDNHPGWDEREARVESFLAANPKARLIASSSTDTGTQMASATGAGGMEVQSMSVSEDQRHLAVAVALVRQGDLTRARAEVAASAELGNAQAQVILANMQIEGIGGPKDPATGFQNLVRLADGGNSYAQFRVGQMYGSGLNAPRDNAKSLDYFKMAADQHVGQAVVMVARAYASGSAGPKDPVKAQALLMDETIYNSAEVSAELAHAYAYGGYGLTKDLSRALGIVQDYEGRHQAWAYAQHAALFADGLVTGTPDYASARQYYSEAARLGSGWAEYWLGHFAERGLGQPADFYGAKAHYARAATLGDMAAKIASGRLAWAAQHYTRPTPKDAAEQCEMLANETGTTADRFPAVTYIDVAKAAPACEDALKQHPADERLKGLLARVEAVQGHFAAVTRLVGKTPKTTDEVDTYAYMATVGKLPGAAPSLTAAASMVAKSWDKTHAALLADDYAGDLLNGRGVPKDIARGMEILRTCAAQKDLYCMADLGAIYLRGSFDQPADEKAGLALLQEAADKYDFQRARSILVQIMRDKGVASGEVDNYLEPFMKDASSCAQSGDRFAMVASAMQINRTGGDAETRVKYLQDAADSIGSATALAQLAYHYALGAAVPKDLAKARELARRAEAAGSQNAVKGVESLVAQQGG